MSRVLLVMCLWLVARAATAQDNGPGLGAIPDGLTIRTDEEFYDVRGSTADELRKSMRELGPFETGRRWNGYTRWNISWRFRYAMQSGMCRMTDVKVDYAPLIVLPKWNGSPRASAELRRQWDDFVTALRLHEEGHRYIGAEAARETLRRLRDVTSPTCTSISAEASTLARRTLDEFREIQRQYDEETGHGASQGARWPPR